MRAFINHELFPRSGRFSISSESALDISLLAELITLPLRPRSCCVEADTLTHSCLECIVISLGWCGDILHDFMKCADLMLMYFFHVIFLFLESISEHEMQQ